MRKMYLLMLTLIIFGAANVKAQVTIGSQNDPNAGAVLDLQSTTKGLLLPRVVLTSTTSGTPIAHTAGMIVYNTATSNDVTPGYYYNNGTKWLRIADSSVSSGVSSVGVTAPIVNSGTVSAPILGLSDAGVTASKLASNSVNSAKIVDGSIVAADLADNAVTIAKLPSGATTTTYLRGDGAWATPSTGLPSTATIGQILKWNGTSWIASNPTQSNNTVSEISTIGKNGTPGVEMASDGTMILTHEYPTGIIDGKIVNQVWMISDWARGSAASSTECPSGWRKPKYNEFILMDKYLKWCDLASASLWYRIYSDGPTETIYIGEESKMTLTGDQNNKICVRFSSQVETGTTTVSRSALRCIKN